MRRMKHIAIIFILLISSTLHSAQDTASFEISAYNIGLNPSTPEIINIEIGDAVTGGILDSSNKIVIPNIENMLVDDISHIEGGDHPDHNEEIVFSYLISGYDFISDSTYYYEEFWYGNDKHWYPKNYELTISLSPFRTSDGTEFSDFKYRLGNVTSSFENNTSQLVAVCQHTAYDNEIYSTATMNYFSGHVSPNDSGITHDWHFRYSSCNYSVERNHRNTDYMSPYEWNIRGAVSLVFDREAYENAPIGKYTSTVTLILKTTN